MKNTNTTRIDIVSVGFILSMLALVAFWTVQGNLLTHAVSRPMSWQFIRSTGMSAYILFTLSTMWGLVLSSRMAKDWSPGSLSMLLHSSISWLGVVLALIHGVLLLFDNYVSYQIHQILIPFMGVYRPFAVGLGVITFWLMLIVASSFAFKKRLGHKWWKRLHYTSYVGFFMVTAHAYFAGTDADRFGFQILLGIAVMIVIVLTGNRMGAIAMPRLESS